MGQLLRYAAILALVAVAAWVTVPKGHGGNIPAELCCRAPADIETASR